MLHADTCMLQKHTATLLDKLLFHVCPFIQPSLQQMLFMPLLLSVTPSSSLHFDLTVPCKLVGRCDSSIMHSCKIAFSKLSNSKTSVLVCECVFGVFLFVCVCKCVYASNTDVTSWLFSSQPWNQEAPSWSWSWLSRTTDKRCSSPWSKSHCNWADTRKSTHRLHLNIRLHCTICPCWNAGAPLFKLLIIVSLLLNLSQI